MQNFKKILFSLVLFNLVFVNLLTAKQVPDSFADLAEKLMPSVVNISTTQTIKTTANPFPFQFPPGSPFEEMFKDYNQPKERKASSLGSGFIINKNGTVITNNHVINNADDIVVKVGDKEYKAKIIGADPYADVAVLKIDSKDIFKPVKFGNSDKARVGDWVIAIGNPFGLGGTVTSGIISARNRDINLTRYDDFIQTDASINQGNSGGPLFNLNGDVIGVNTAIIGQGGSVGIGFAIPANAASDVVDQLIKYGETRRGWLGVRIQEVTKEIADISSSFISRTVIFKLSIDFSFFFIIFTFFSLNSSEDSNLPSFNFFDNIFLFRQISRFTVLPTSVRETSFGNVLIVSIFFPSNFKIISPALSPALSAGLFSPTLAISAPCVFFNPSTSAISLVTS